ncbi:sodium-dependent transporter [Halococcus sp. AFM35]|uniref:sodium-dependent transporter n=1 Tax=Halococcus sp. AFM35 TaxID=3421653 RepID=UPI003EB9B355
MAERETWTTRLGFILAAVGSAVGLGNIWRFPFATSANGGAAFVIVTLLAVLIIGIPALLAEFVIGRRSNTDAIGAFRKLGRPGWRFVGAIGVFASFWTLSYYSVVGGWVMRYVLGTATGNALATPETYFGSISVGVPSVASHAVFMAVTIVIVAFGIERGIELATKFMVPAIVVLLVGLAVFAATLPGAGDGYAFLLNPDFGYIIANAGSVLPAAFGQALFSLSVGFSVMITYASYLGEDDSLPIDGLSIAVTNFAIAFIAGLVVIPLLVVQGLQPGAGGISATFVAIPTALAELGGLLGQVVGVVFFFVVLIAALSSAISLLEAVVAYLVDSFGFSRVPTAVGLGVVIFVVGIPSAWNTAWLAWFDGIGVALLLPVTVLFVVLFVGWVLGRDAIDEFTKGSGAGWLASVWLWGLRTVVLLLVVIIVALNLQDLFLTPSGSYIIPGPLR